MGRALSFFMKCVWGYTTCASSFHVLWFDLWISFSTCIRSGAEVRALPALHILGRGHIDGATAVAGQRMLHNITNFSEFMKAITDCGLWWGLTFSID